MIHRSLPYEPTAEDRLTRTKSARGFGIVHGTILLLLLAIVTAQHIRGERIGATAIANDPAAQPVRTELRSTIAIGAPTGAAGGEPQFTRGLGVTGQRSPRSDQP